MIMQRAFGLTLSRENGQELSECGHRHAGWMITIGTLLILLGAWACARFVAATMASMMVLGGFLAAGGILHAVNAFSARKWTSTLLDVLAAVLYFLGAVTAFRQPVMTAGVFTLLIACFYMAIGVSRIVASLAIRPVQWGWVLFHGMVSFALGIIVFLQWPASALWFVGIVIGVDLIFSGWALLALGLSTRRYARSHPAMQPSRA